ncbi:MAG: Rrf2 family transcriptional regulator [Bdellovibrionales bacterium]|nr:Rrf2 family transcriptional regulator [Bdellovibrionales bacterium]
MHISSLEEYGLRCALQLARRFGAGQAPASLIAQEEGVSTEYVSKVMFLFRKAGLILASRGSQGGFSLSRAPSEVTLKDVIDAVNAPQGSADMKGDDGFCSQFKGKATECVHFTSCSVRPVWSLISGYFDGVLKELTLGDLLSHEAAVNERVGETARRKSTELTSAILGGRRRTQEHVAETVLYEGGVRDGD